MTWGLAGAITAACLYGVTTVLQSVAVRRRPPAVGLDVRLLRGLATSPLYVATVVAELGGFLLSLAALRSLPLFVVQAVLCGNFAVAAIVAHVWLAARLGLRERVAVAVVTAGIVLLALSARVGAAVPFPTAGRVALVAAAGGIAAAAFFAARWGSHYGPPLLGMLAGLGFGLTDVAARVLRDPLSPLTLLRDPATLALAAGGILGTWLYATALQRAHVTTVVAAQVVAYTIAPAVVGVTALGDHPRAGFVPVAAVGFALAVAGALALARYGVSPGEPAPAPSPGSPRTPAPDQSAR